MEHLIKDGDVFTKNREGYNLIFRLLCSLSLNILYDKHVAIRENIIYYINPTSPERVCL